MENQKQKGRKNKHISVIQIIRAVIQLAAFIAAPGLFITIFSSIGEIFKSLINGQFSFAEYSGRIILLAAVFIVTFIWGRFFCGFICSFGAMQDLLWAGGKHIKHRPKISEKADKGLKFIKFGVLLFVIIAVWSFSLTDGILWSPWTIFGMYATIKGFPSAEYLLSLGGLLLLLIIIGSVFVERFFCKYLCPLGALFDLISHFRIFKIKKPTEKCGNCRMCTKQCSMSIPLYRYESVNSGECINCMKCTESCPRQNAKADTIPAVSGTIAAAALVGVYYVGTIPALNGGADTVQDNISEISNDDSTGKFKNGTYSGTGSGFRGNINVTVTVSGGKITEITVNSYNDDKEFFEKAKNKIISEIISKQDTDVSTVSGATFSSKGIIDAVSNALDLQLIQNSMNDYENSENTDSTSEDTSKQNNTSENTESSAEQSGSSNGKFKDGTYSGSGKGFRGTTNVSVTVENGKITDIEIVSYQDDMKFFSKAESSVIFEIISKQSTDVSTVSGATFSSNGIIEAVLNALKLQSVENSKDTSEPNDTSDNNENSTEQSGSSNGKFQDGTYSGSGTGFRGTTNVSVTVENGSITDIEIVSYQDDMQFFSRAESSVISEIISKQSTDVSTVSGATFSSNGIIEAVSNALGIEFENPNSTMGGNRHGRH